MLFQRRDQGVSNDARERCLRLQTTHLVKMCLPLLILFYYARLNKKHSFISFLISAAMGKARFINIPLLSHPCGAKFTLIKIKLVLLISLNSLHHSEEKPNICFQIYFGHLTKVYLSLSLSPFIVPAWRL